MTTTQSREDLRQAWNAALAADQADSTDATRAEVKRIKETYLSRIHRGIVDDCMEMQARPAYRTPEWLRERVNDRYGTPNKVLVDGVLVDNPFWQDVDFEVVGVWKLFERDGWWFGYKTTQNAWAHFATKADAITMASGPQVDIWA